jgi:putative nucleotidyltransferase with HDIG domain
MYLHKLGGSWLDHPFVRGRFLITDKNDIKRIAEAGINEVWIDIEKGDDVAEPAQADIEATIEEQQETTEEGKQEQTEKVTMEAAVAQARKLCDDAKEQVETMFEHVRLGKAIKSSETTPLIDEIESMIDKNAEAMLSVARIKTHDDYTYMHSVAVSALMIALAKQLKLAPHLIHLAGVAGLVHDFGKAYMPLEVLNKPGRLSEKEFAIMRKHPEIGAKALDKSKFAPEVVDVVLHHHEKVDGTGYPDGLKGEEISLLARMGAICDVYDAITSNRPYKEAWDPSGAIRQMASWKGSFDRTLMKAFISAVGIYPVGSLVRLESGLLAVIVETSELSLLTPKVKVFFSAKLKEPVPVKTIDLAEPDCKEKIEVTEDPTQWNFNDLTKLWM